MSLLHAKEPFRDAQRKLDHEREPELYDFALGMRLLIEGLEALKNDGDSRPSCSLLLLADIGLRL